MSDDKKTLNRREFLERAALVGAVALGAGSFLTACETQTEDTEETEEATTGVEESDFSCDDEAALADLSEGDIEQRENVEYTDASPNAEEVCDNCVFWEDPEGDAQCGGCTAVPGPIHPNGWCNLWTAA